MPASEARIAANRANAARSTGPKTVEGKEQSRRNALKHGLAGAGVVLPEKDAAEVERKAEAYAREMNASGEIGHDLARRAALNAVRMDRAADQQTAALAERVRRVEAEFVAPEGVSAEEADRLRAEAVRIAMFDPSPEATLARKYEAAAERGFHKALKDLRQHEASVRTSATPSPADNLREAHSIMASFEQWRKEDEEFDKLAKEMGMPLTLPPSQFTHLPPMGSGFDLPMTIGRRP